MFKPANLLAAAIALAVSSLAAHADTVYTYTGNTFTSYSGPFTSSDSITGSFTMASPLPANMVIPSNVSWNSSINWTSFSFSDGVDTITDLTVNPSLALIAVGTDASGNITSWLVNLYTPFDGKEIFTSTGAVEDYASGSGIATVFDNPGTWSSNNQTEPPSAAAPEPSGLALMGTGLLGAVGAIRRKFLRA